MGSLLSPSDELLTHGPVSRLHKEHNGLAVDGDCLLSYYSGASGAMAAKILLYVLHHLVLGVLWKS